MKRKHEISYVNILLCIAVIMIHVTSDAVSGLTHGSAAYYPLYIFWRLLLCAVPGFIFLSGLKLSLRPVTDWKRFYTRRFTSVMIPYLIWMPVYYIASWRMNYYDISVSDFFIRLINGTSTAHFYFIIVIAQFYLLMPLWQLLTKKVNAWILLAAAAVITGWSQAWLPVIVENRGLNLPLTNDRMFINYLLPWIAGCVCGAHYEKVKSWLVRLRFSMYTLCIGLAVSDILFSDYVKRSGEIYLQVYYVNMMYCLSAIFSLWAFFSAVSETRAPGRFLQRLDKSSYYIYLSHLLILMIARYILDIHAPDMGPLYRMAIYLPVTLIIPTALCMAYTALRDHILTTNSV